MKERLTGAIILVVLIVLLVPELLSGPKGPAATPPAAGAASPSSEEPPLRSYTINLGDDSHTQSETANGAAGSSGPPQPSVQPAQPTTQAATPEKDLTESSSWDTSADAAASHRPPIRNSVAATQPAPSSQQRHAPTSPNLRRLAERRASHRSASTANHGTVRSRHRSRSIAQRRHRRPTNRRPTSRRARSRRSRPVQRRRTKPLPSHIRHRAPAASESGGWGVQLGVFASKENAERLALDVRTKGFKVSVSPVTSGKRKLYRVRVGPAADKSAAQDLQSKLKAAGRPGGTVVPYS